MGFRKQNEKQIFSSRKSPKPINLNELSKRDALILKLYAEGLSSYKIADRLDINRHTVTRVLNELDVPIRSKTYYKKQRKARIIKLHKEGKSIREISKITGLTQYTVRKTLEDEKLVFSKYERDLLKIARYVQMKNRGYDNEDVASFLNMTCKEMNKLLRNSGIKPSVVRRKTENLKNLPDIIEKRLKGISAKEIALEYKIELLHLKDILEDFGLFKKI